MSCCPLTELEARINAAELDLNAADRAWLRIAEVLDRHGIETHHLGATPSVHIGGIRYELETARGLAAQVRGELSLARSMVPTVPEAAEVMHG